MNTQSNRSSTRAGAGLKGVRVDAQPHKVTLDAATVEVLRELGSGNVSAGVRVAAARALRPVQPHSDAEGYAPVEKMRERAEAAESRLVEFKEVFELRVGDLEARNADLLDETIQLGRELAAVRELVRSLEKQLSKKSPLDS